MKTTLNLDDRLLERAKQVAARENSTLTALVEDALRARLTSKRRAQSAFRLQLPTVRPSGEQPLRTSTSPTAPT